jgi:solute carrier family 50 (sugar transporter)
VILVNAIGVFLFALYCITYYMFTVNKRRMTHQLVLVILMITFSVGYSKVEPDDSQASRLIGKCFVINQVLSLLTSKFFFLQGLLCCSVGVFFFASPLIKLKHVIATKNTEVLPRPIIIASFFVSLQWSIYGFLINDPFIQVSQAGNSCYRE